MNSVGQLASGIWEDLDSPDTPTVTSISGWVGSDRALGKLNALLGTEFIIDSAGYYNGQYFDAGGYSGQYVPGDYYPAFGNVEAAIMGEVYKYDFYAKKIRNVMNGILEGTGTNVDWSELSEGDTTIRRSNRNEVAKTYRGLQTDSNNELQRLVGYYRQNKALPREVTTQEPHTSNRILISWNGSRRQE
jgi:hypothetical protein